MISPGTSSLLPSGREPPFIVVKATRGEGVGRCSAPAQCNNLKGTVFWYSFLSDSYASEHHYNHKLNNMYRNIFKKKSGGCTQIMNWSEFNENIKSVQV